MKSNRPDNFHLHQWLNSGAIISIAAEKVLLGWGNATWEAEPSLTSFYFPDFFLHQHTPWLTFEHHAIRDVKELLLEIENIPSESASAIRWENTTKTLFENGFNALQHHFQNNDLTKLVLYTLSTSADPYTTAHRIRSLSSVLRYVSEASAYAYGFWNDIEGLLGATPELLFRFRNIPSPTLETMALAGTQKTDSLSPLMLNDPKLLDEHHIVVNDIVERLSSLGHVHLGNLEVLTLPLLSHLHTSITVDLQQANTFDTFVKTLHPTPALGGHPRTFAQKWLSGYSRLLPRGRFGAPVGFTQHSTGTNACYVAIRNMMWDRNGLVIGAGCGITAHSELDNEWDELLLKTKSIKQLLQV